MARQRWVVAVLAISLGTIACKKKEEAKTGQGSGTNTSDPAVTKKDTPVTPAAPAQGDLGLIPVDSEAVIGVNWGQLLASPIWKQYVEPEMKKDADFTANIEKFKTRCGFDPFAVVKQMSVGMKGLGGDKPDGIMVLHGIDKAQAMACADKWQDEAAKEKVTITKDGDVILAKDESGDGLGATFLADGRMLAVIGVNVDAAAVKKAAQGGSTLSTSPAFVDMYGKINKDQSLWFLVNGNSKLFEDAAQLGLRPKAVFGSVNVTDAISADARARLESADEATKTVANFGGQVKAMAGMFDKLDMTADGPDVKLSAAASTTKLQNLFKLIATGGM